MTRLTSIAMAIATLTLVTPAFAQQAELAAKDNDEGKELMFAGNFAAASAKFRSASARVNEPKYFFNLCTSLFQEGKFDEAMTACSAVDKNSPTPDLHTKTEKLEDKIKDEAKRQNYTLHPTSGGGGGDQNLTTPPDPTNPNPNPNPNPQPAFTPAVGRPPAQNLFKAAAPENKYTWTLGFEAFGGGGRIGQSGYFGSSAGGFRIKSDYLLNAATRIGAQGYVQYQHFGQGDMQSSSVLTLDVVDLGVAAYKHLCAPNARMCITPLAGVQLALMSPAGENDGSGNQLFNYSALGARLEVGLSYGLGTRMEHVLGVGLGVNIYSAVFSESMDAAFSSETIGLDRGGAAGYFGVGYTYRFNTPLGSSPFVTLE